MPPIVMAVRSVISAFGGAAAIGAAAGSLIAPMAMSKLMKKDVPDQGRMVTIRNPAAFREVVYGECRKGAVPTFLHLSAAPDHPYQYLVVVYTISGHPVNSIVYTFLDGNKIVWGDGYNTNPRMPLFWQEGYSTDMDYQGQVWANFKLGTPSEPAFPGVVGICQHDGSNLWTTNHRQDGCASAGMVFSWNQNVFPNGAPTVTFQIQGKKLYDLRTSTTAYSKNVALAIYDYLCSKEYGLGCDPTEINTSSFIAAANACEEHVNLKAGSYELRYQVNGTFSVESDPQDVLAKLGESMAGYVSYSQGQWYCIPGVWQSPSIYLNEDDLRAPVQAQFLRQKRDLCNSVRGTFFAAVRKFQKCDYPAVVHPGHVLDDSGYANAVEKGQWTTATTYSANDSVIDSFARAIKGLWVTSHAYSVNDYVSDSNHPGSVYCCTAAHTSGSTTEPGTGASWTSYWADVTAQYYEYRGGIYVCTQAHTSAAANRPGIGAQWTSYWVEAQEYIWKSLDLNFTTSPSMCQRIAKINLERSRHQITATLKCKLGALQLQPGDTFYLSYAHFGWVNKAFQVLQCDLVTDYQDTAPVLGVDLVVQETDASIYTWDETTEEQSLDLPAQPVIPPTEIPGSRQVVFGNGFTHSWNHTTSTLTLSWDYTGDNAIIMLDSDVTYTPSGSQAITGLTAGATYLFYPYYDIANDAFSCLMSDGTGTPAWAEIDSSTNSVIAARWQEWNRSGIIPLDDAPVKITIPATGSGTGGSGGPRGGGGGRGGPLRPLIDFQDAFHANKNIDNLDDGASYVRTTTTQRDGGGRAYSALDSDNRLVDQLRMPTLAAVYAPSGTSPLSQPTSSRTIAIASFTMNIGSSAVNYNSGSVLPATYGTFYVYADDPTYSGGAVTYYASSDPHVLTQNDGRIVIGVITTDGSGGGSGSDTCFSPNVRVITRRGDIPFMDIRPGDLVLTARRTWRKVLAVTAREWAGEMLDMGSDELTTPGHHFKSASGWQKVGTLGLFDKRVSYAGIIHNLIVEAEPEDDGTGLDTEHSYTLANGYTVHNIMGTM